MKLAGIDIDHSDNSGCTAFYRSCQKGNIEIVSDFINHCVIVLKSQPRLSQFQAALDKNHVNADKDLIECELNDIEENTTCDWAYEDWDVVKGMDLISHFGFLQKNNKYGLTPLQVTTTTKT